jgi:hypothetical protein
MNGMRRVLVAVLVAAVLMLAAPVATALIGPATPTTTRPVTPSTDPPPSIP